MPSLVIPNTVMVRLLWSQGTHAPINVMGALKTGTVTVNQTLANTVGSAIKSAFTSSGQAAQVGTGTSLLNVGLRDIATANLPEFLDNGAAVPGTATGDPLPPQIAQCVTLRTASAGKSFRGRIYLPGYTEAASDTSGQVSVAARTAAAAFVNAINSALNGSAMALAVMSRPNSATGKVGFSTTVTLVQLRDAIWDTQRRRAR
jgi:hypothetical protein